MKYFGFFDHSNVLTIVLKKPIGFDSEFYSIIDVFNSQGLTLKEISEEEYNNFDS